MYLYLHSSKEGKKIDILKKNNNVCFEIDLDKELNSSSVPCKSSICACRTEAENRPMDSNTKVKCKILFM